jgi:hypothetical protein
MITTAHRNTTSTERRENSRFPMTLECAISVDNRNFHRCRTRDISQDGAFILTDLTRFAPNTRVQLAVRTMVDGRAEVRRYQAQVRHVTAEGLGLYLHPPEGDSLVDTVMRTRRL